MPDWLIERGVGETRAVRLQAGEIAEARIFLDDLVQAGTMLEARLTEVGIPAIAESGGTEYFLPAGAPGVTQGDRLAIEVTRERIPGEEPWKRPLARVTDGGPGPAPQLDSEMLPFPSPDDRLEQAGW